MKKQILISGGGVAGAGIACAIAKVSNDLSITVLEKETEESIGSVRRGEVLRPEASKAIREAGLMDFIVTENPVVRYSPKPEIWHTTLGKMGSIDYSIMAPDYPMLYLPHKQIVKSLHKAMKDLEVSVQYGTESDSVNYEEGRPLVNFHHRDNPDELEKIGADLLIIADGATSKLRSSLDFSIDFYDYKSGYLMVIIDKPKDLEWGRHYIGENTFLGLFSLPGDIMRAAIEVHSQDMKEWLALDNEQLKERMVRLAPILSDSAVRRVGGFYHVFRRHSKRYVSERVALIGDAAHTTHPQLGQGMSMVFHDVETLSRLILSNPNSDFSEEDLIGYEKLCWPYNDQIIRNAHELTEALEAIGKDPSAIDLYSQVLQRVGFQRN